MRVAFLGNPAAATPSLEALIDSKHEIVGVVTAPDRPKGRGMKLESTPVKKAAQTAALKVEQPSTLKTPEAQELLRGLGADIFVVVAYGFILPPAVLAIPRFGCVNVHFSILPQLRGAAPVQWALIQGHEKTGVTIMQLDEGMDTGPIFAVSEEPIKPDDNIETLEARLAIGGADLLLEVMNKLEQHQIAPYPQDESAATYAPKILKADARIDWAQTAEAVVNRVRGLTPRPGAWAVLESKRLKIWKASVDVVDSSAPPGTLEVGSSGFLQVHTGSKLVTLDELQPENKVRMAGVEFVRGYRPKPGSRLDSID